jgi:hypothetical protein
MEKPPFYLWSAADLFDWLIHIPLIGLIPLIVVAGFLLFLALSMTSRQQR